MLEGRIGAMLVKCTLAMCAAMIIGIAVPSMAQAAISSGPSPTRDGWTRITDTADNSTVWYDCSRKGTSRTWMCYNQFGDYVEVTCYENTEYDYDNGTSHTYPVCSASTQEVGVSVVRTMQDHRGYAHLPGWYVVEPAPAPVQNTPISTGSDGNNC